MSSNRSFYESLDVSVPHKHRDIMDDDFSLVLAQQEIQKHLGSLKGAWLDVGTGRGRVSNLAQGLGLEYVGIDLSAQNVAYAQKHFPMHTFVTGDFLEYPWQKKFVLITFFSTLHHFEDWNRALAVAQSLLAPGGKIYIEQEPLPLFARLYRWGLQLFSPHWKELKEVEIHWAKKPPISITELPAGETVYHWDFLPGLRRLKLGTKKTWGKKLFSHYRHWISGAEKSKIVS